MKIISGFRIAPTPSPVQAMPSPLPVDSDPRPCSMLQQVPAYHYAPLLRFGAQERMDSHPMVRQGETALKDWAQREGLEPTLLPAIKIDRDHKLGEHIVAGYAAQEHTIYVHPERMDQVKRNVDELFVHEGTHGALALFRTLLKREDPAGFQKRALDAIKIDTLRGDKRMLAMSNAMLIPRPYIPSQESRQKVADYLQWVIDHKQYDITQGEAILTKDAPSKFEQLCYDIPDYWPLFASDSDSEEKQTAGGQLGGTLLAHYIKAQLFRYHLMLEESVIPEGKMHADALRSSLSEMDRKKAIRTLQDYPASREAGLLTGMTASHTFSPNYPSLFYLGGNNEEYLAHKAGFKYRLGKATQQLKTLGTHDARNERAALEATQKTCQNDIQLLRLSRSYSKLVRQVNQLPRDQEVEKKRIALLVPLEVSKQAYASALEAYHADPSKSQALQNDLFKKGIVLEEQLAEYYKLSAPETLFEASEKRSALLEALKRITDEMKPLAKNTSITLLPPFLFDSLEQAFGNQSSGVQQLQAQFRETHLKEQDLSAFIYHEAFTPERLLSYQSGV